MFFLASDRDPLRSSLQHINLKGGRNQSPERPIHLIDSDFRSFFQWSTAVPC